MADTPAVKICGLRHRDDVVASAEFGAAYLGFILTAGFARSVDAVAARAMVAGVAATPVAVLVDEPPVAAAALGHALGAGVVQLHGQESVETVREVGVLGPWLMWKSVRAHSLDDVRRAVDLYAPWVQGIVVEGWKEGVVGGGGAALAADQFDELRDVVPSAVSLIVAGGLTTGTVADAVARWAPDVVDVSSGVEVQRGRKDRELLHRFIRAAHSGAHPDSSDPSDSRGALR